MWPAPCGGLPVVLAVTEVSSPLWTLPGLLAAASGSPVPLCVFVVIHRKEKLLIVNTYPRFYFCNSGL